MKAIKYMILCALLLLISACSGTKKLDFKDGLSFSKEERALIMQADSSVPMRVFKIDSKQDSLLLRTKSSPVHANPKDPVLQNVIKRIYRTVRDSMSLGVGIAAPQVGEVKNIIWVQRFDKEEFPFEVYLNPKILSYSEQKQTFTEGCLSIPNRTETLNNRAYSIEITYDSMENKQHTEAVEGFTAVIFQHEIDHLNGILYLDHLEKEIKDSN